MEQLQVHSKVRVCLKHTPGVRGHQANIANQSYIVRWINVGAGYSISWTLQPHKKGLNFGIFKHPGTKTGVSPNIPTAATFEPPPTPTSTASEVEGGRPKRGSISRKDSGTVVEKLESIGIKCVAWTGKCEADKVSQGVYDIPEGEGGMYGLVFDNTFSKQVSKTATFVLMTHPTNAPPKSGAHLHYSQGQASASSTSVGRPSPVLRPVSASADSVTGHTGPSAPSIRVTKQAPAGTAEAEFHTGSLSKKRRKKNQGYARRFFSLDFTSSTLSYYRNRHSAALRGAVPLSLTCVGVNQAKREFSIDSGAEVWHLRAGNRQSFEAWKKALERAAASTLITPSPATPLAALPRPASASWNADPEAEREWTRVEGLVGRVSGSRDAMRRLAQDTDPKYVAHPSGALADSPSSLEVNPFFQDLEEKSSDRLPFWKRKPSSSSMGGNSAGLFRRSVSAQVAPTPISVSNMSPPLTSQQPKPRSPLPQYGYGNDVHERCMALLRDLDATVADFSSLLAESKARRMPPLQTSFSRMSMESTRSQDFFDAEEGPSQLLEIRASSDSEHDAQDFVSDNEESETSSDAGDRAMETGTDGGASTPQSLLFPARAKILSPKEAPHAQYRSTIQPPKQPPPSILGFLRKNAGKDLSTVSMPVSANEPTSMLQRLAEPLEAAHLLTKAASSALSGADQAAERLLHVAAFAAATFASNRVKERAIRKPFNPMLGETYELVRRESDNPNDMHAYRFVAEKVTHHPVRMAWQADSLSGAWSLAQSPQPTQKFWGKSVELNTDGKWRLALYPSADKGDKSQAVQGGERYTWTTATMFLRNVIAGEKYVEPVASMTILNESTGHHAVATFKASGMFSGRSEDVSISLFAPGSSTPLPVGATGKWTTSLVRSDTGAAIWTAGPLVPDAARVYGFTSFAATLNQEPSEQEVKEGRIPSTDSRLRPDQRALEEGYLDKAEAVKARLEERQRARRKVRESHGVEWKPRFFERVDEVGGGTGVVGEEVWKLKMGKEGYWECRERAEWTGLEEVFEL